MQHRVTWLMRVRPTFIGSILKKALRIRRQVVETPNERIYIDPASNFGHFAQSEEGYTGRLRPVDHGRLVEKRFAVYAGRDKIAAGQHFPGDFRIIAFIFIEKRDAAQIDKNTHKDNTKKEHGKPG